MSKTVQPGKAPREDRLDAASAEPLHWSPEKRTRIHEVMVNERNAPRVRSPNFNISVGTRVGRRFYHPGWSTPVTFGQVVRELRERINTKPR